MKLRDIMTHDVTCVTPDTTLQEAAETMKQLDVGALPVCEDGRLAGMVTDRDMVVRGLAAGRQGSTQVGEVMTPGVVWAYDDEPVDDAAQKMQERQIRRLPVLDRDKRLVGIVSIGDVAVRARDDKLTGQTLEQISEQPATNGL